MRTADNEATLAKALAFSQTDAATALGFCPGTRLNAVPVPFFGAANPEGIEIFCPKIGRSNDDCDDGGVCLWRLNHNSPEAKNPIITCPMAFGGELTLYKDERTATSPLRPATTVDLRPHPALFSVLHELMLLRGGVASYDKLYHGYLDRMTRVGENSVQPDRWNRDPKRNLVHSDVSRLRGLLGETPDDDRKIFLNVQNVGYRINAQTPGASRLPSE